jgi:hypothetical protein
MSHIVANENMVVDKNGNISKVAYTNYPYTYPCGTLSHPDKTTYFVNEKGVITYYNLPDQPITQVEVPSVESVVADTPTPPKEMPIISIEKGSPIDQYKSILKWYFLFKEYSVFLVNEPLITPFMDTARQFFKDSEIDLDKNEISSGDLTFDDMDNIMRHIEIFATKKQTYIDNDAIKNDKKVWLNDLHNSKIPTIGRLCDHIIQNGNSHVERHTKKMIALYGKKLVSSWWDEYRGEPIDF